MNIYTITNRLMRVWHSATRTERTNGRQWYNTARAQARLMANDHNVSVSTAAGCIAALSPRLHWVRNVRVANDCLARRKVTGVFRFNLRKANAIRDGAKPLSVLSGPKVRAFYRAICGDETAAVIDVWMVKAIGLLDRLTEKAYARISEAMAVAAARLRVTVAALQATVWIAVRGKAT